MESAHVIQFLQRTPLFGAFSKEELEAIIKTSREREFSPGEVILREGDPSNLGFYLILSGQAEVRKGSKSLAKLKTGDFFGEMALLLDTPRTADVVALEKTRCLLLTRWALRSLISTYPDMALKIQAELARRLLNTNQALSE
ncbi:MAG: cyclic nucleotide-binding domain-containing protein [Candidatus Bipolaricaulota bacterium]|nr:cyclic nucleotide-binding domain-containing protein [Candidatus Bipolaricaulota bacterium]MCS7274188.1 cyclic nucleotide-binding domain-containing protein [Candidatus Bipolaricaulota bacterium]MDW8110094.1 cyclic nucleotide-binding domain-containing protein [Candidatus Bipolaricaulota bacterium]MDW8328986.1 cyclic nucleotide-binding domain-containing protein [Candidatus Bipolaricaulota bacterium]